jgi:hypothetical protein
VRDTKRRGDGGGRGAGDGGEGGDGAGEHAQDGGAQPAPSFSRHQDSAKTPFPHGDVPFSICLGRFLDCFCLLRLIH